MKTFKLEITENEDGTGVMTNVENKGFNNIELLGLLELFKNHLLQQDYVAETNKNNESNE